MMLQPHLSTEREVVLDDVDFAASGHYRCDVSGDAPAFHTDSREGLLFVVGAFVSENYPNLCLCPAVGDFEKASLGIFSPSSF